MSLSKPRVTIEETVAVFGGRQPLEPRVLSFIQQHNLVPPFQPLLLAVSGGPDSVCLLHILSKLQKELGATLHVAHLNHQLRGADADADAQYVSDLAKRLGIPATIGQRDVRAYQAQQHLSLEEAAREVRYTFLAEMAGSVGAGRVAVGHTLDDHIETVLLHLVRGTGTRGLRGLLPVNEWHSSTRSITIIRPLLQVSRDETARYCAEYQLMPRLDVSNLSLSPLRNKIRHQLLPQLRSYNPRINEALLRTARIASGDVALLDEQVDRVWDEIARREQNTIILDKRGFDRLPFALRRNLLRTAIEKLIGNVRDIEMRHVDGVMAALSKPAGRRLHLPSGLTFYIDYDRFLIGQGPTVLSPLPELKPESRLSVPGETILAGWRVKTAILSRAAAGGDMATPPVAGEKSYRAYFDFDKVGSNLVVRSRRPGDRFQPLGMSQPKKLNEFMIDEKIPRPWRERVPVVSGAESIIWLVGYRIDEQAKVTSATERVLFIEFDRS